AIIPICIGLSYLTARREARAEGGDTTGAGRRPLWRLVPAFLIGVIAVTAVNSLGWIPAPAQASLGGASDLLITLARVALGLPPDLPALRKAGARPLLLGALLWLVVTLTSPGLQTIPA